MLASFNIKSKSSPDLGTFGFSLPSALDSLTSSVTNSANSSSVSLSLNFLMRGSNSSILSLSCHTIKMPTAGHARESMI